MLRAGRAATAERWLRSLEAQCPGNLSCRWLLGVALLEQGQLEGSILALEQVLSAAPDFADARVDLTRAYRRIGRAGQAREEARRVLEKFPRHHRAWLAYGETLVDLGQYPDAVIAFERAKLTDPEREGVEAATAALAIDDRKQAENIFRDILRRDAAHVAALCGLAALSLLADVPRDAERLLRHALSQCAHHPLAYRGLGPALIAMGRLEEAELAARHLMKLEPRNPQTWVMLAGVATRLMRQEEALEAYQRAAELKPDEVGLRMSIGHVHKTLGHRQESEQSYKQALLMDAGRAEAYWSLADLKNYRFTDREVDSMQRLLTTDKRGCSNEAQLNFALGKAFEQRQQYAAAFAYYAQGNALRRVDAPFDIEAFERRTERIRRFFSADFFAARQGSGNPSPAPIFIVGLPRSGSTLIEQILASHSCVEGTMELPNILNFVSELDHRAAQRDGYPEQLAGISPSHLLALGTRYLEETAPLRHGRERFTDKLPNNFSHIGLIQLILPQAVVIDARRHPLDACFSTFKQYFAEGQTFSYDLRDLGRYYRCYLTLMDHWNAVLPGKVLQLNYEELVADPESSIHKLLSHCGLAFEPACLSFHQTRRSVRTASAEQVRQPIYSTAVGHWRHYARELEPLRLALADSLQRWPC